MSAESLNRDEDKFNPTVDAEELTTLEEVFDGLEIPAPAPVLGEDGSVVASGFAPGSASSGYDAGSTAASGAEAGPTARSAPGSDAGPAREPAVEPVAGPASGPLGSPGGRLCGRHPQDVTGPQVPVGASHRNTVPALLGAAAGELGLRGVEVAVGQTSAHPLDEPGLTAGQRARVPARADVGRDPVLGVEAAPGAGLILRCLRRVRAQAGAPGAPRACRRQPSTAPARARGLRYWAHES